MATPPATLLAVSDALPAPLSLADPELESLSLSLSLRLLLSESLSLRACDMLSLKDEPLSESDRVELPADEGELELLDDDELGDELLLDALLEDEELLLELPLLAPPVELLPLVPPLGLPILTPSIVGPGRPLIACVPSRTPFEPICRFHTVKTAFK